MTESFIRWFSVETSDIFPDVSSVLLQLVPPERQSTSRTLCATVIVLLPIIITSTSHDSDTFVMYKTCRAKEKHYQKKKKKPLLTNEANIWKQPRPVIPSPVKNLRPFASTFSRAIHKCTIWVAVMVVVGLAATRPDRTGAGGVSEWVTLPCDARCTTSE